MTLDRRTWDLVTGRRSSNPLEMLVWALFKDGELLLPEDVRNVDSYRPRDSSWPSEDLYQEVVSIHEVLLRLWVEQEYPELADILPVLSAGELERILKEKGIKTLNEREISKVIKTLSNRLDVVESKSDKAPDGSYRLLWKTDGRIKSQAIGRKARALQREMTKNEDVLAVLRHKMIFSCGNCAYSISELNYGFQLDDIITTKSDYKSKKRMARENMNVISLSRKGKTFQLLVSDGMSQKKIYSNARMGLVAKSEDKLEAFGVDDQQTIERIIMNEGSPAGVISGKVARGVVWIPRWKLHEDRNIFVCPNCRGGAVMSEDTSLRQALVEKEMEKQKTEIKNLLG